MLNPGGAGALPGALAGGGYGGNPQAGAAGNFPLGALQQGLQGGALPNVRGGLGLQANTQAGLQANAQNRFAAAQLQPNQLQSTLQQQLAGQFQRQGGLGNANLANGVLGNNPAVAAASVRVGAGLGAINNPNLASMRPGVDRGNIALANLGAAGVGQQNLGMPGYQQASLAAALQQHAAASNAQQLQAAQRLATNLNMGQNNLQQQLQQQQQQNARLQNMGGAVGVNMMQQGLGAGNPPGQELLAMLGRNKPAAQSVMTNTDAYAAIIKQQQQAAQQLPQQAQVQQPGRPQGLQGAAGQDFAPEDFPALPGAAARGDDAARGFNALQGNTGAPAGLGQRGYLVSGDQYGAAGLADLARAQGGLDYDTVLRLQQQQAQAVGTAAAQQRVAVGKAGMGAGPMGGDPAGLKPGLVPGAAAPGVERLGPPPDKWGLLAIMPLLKMTDQDATTLELGINLTTLGLDLTSPSSLHKSLITPLSSQPIKAEPEFELPSCYKHIPQRLHAGYLSKFKDETLFYIFYSMPGDEAQLVAADELSSRSWVYHKRLRMWMMPQPNAPPPVKHQTGERGNYVVFNPAVWDYEPKHDMEVRYEDLEVPPRLQRPPQPQQRPPGGQQPGAQPAPGVQPQGMQQQAVGTGAPVRA